MMTPPTNDPLDENARERCICVLGPTCAWKSEVASILAAELGGEVISCDSMQVYRGMDIGTAKAELGDIPQHLVDILDIHERYDANRFVTEATRVLRDIWARGRWAILAGGTGLYARALIYGFELMPSDPTVYSQILAQSRTPHGFEQLASELAAVDPEFARDVSRNPRRLMRAVEVLRLTGGAKARAARQENELPAFRNRQFIIMPEMSILKPRIVRRTQAMLDAGWVDEARRLVAEGLLTTPTARQALGYREIAAFLEDERNMLQLSEELTRQTVRYARRQRTWFRNQHPGAQVLEIDSCGVGGEYIATEILQRIRAEENE